MEKWNFVGHLTPERVRRLKTAPPFTEIVYEIESQIQNRVNGSDDSTGILCTHMDPCDDLGRYQRLLACIKVTRGLFDNFFNSVNGYRAQYWQNPWIGLAANRFLLARVTPLLLDYHVRHAGPAQKELILKSLAFPSAKAWLAENGLGFCKSCEGEWSPDYTGAEIVNGRWELASDSKALWGKTAPEGTKIVFKGAFVRQIDDNQFAEYVPPDKVNRSQEIHQFGWS